MQEKLFADSLDFTGLDDKTAQEKANHLSDLSMYKLGQLLADSQLTAGLREVSYRLSGGGQPDSLVVLQPAQVKAALETKELPETVKQLADNKKAVCVCALLHAETSPFRFAGGAAKQRGIPDSEVLGHSA